MWNLAALRVSVVSGDRATRERLVILLNASANYQAAGVFSSVNEVLHGLDTIASDIVLIGPDQAFIGVLQERFGELPLIRLARDEKDERILNRLREYDFPRLTPHETRILKLLADGYTYKTAAAVLRVTTHTISFHLRRIYEKLDAHSKSEAVSKALRKGLIPVSDRALSHDYSRSFHPGKAGAGLVGHAAQAQRTISSNDKA